MIHRGERYVAENQSDTGWKETDVQSVAHFGWSLSKSIRTLVSFGESSWTLKLHPQWRLWLIRPWLAIRLHSRKREGLYLAEIQNALRLCWFIDPPARTNKFAGSAWK